ncbi:unnamed protein product [Cuscuta europaea]|uniref:Protein BIG GRAIN 1-like B n=1 Tax=Cuscuta europaea TaxID=41803 RepID=A0A9P1DYL7_CUSEU|nr:unnamed protein product [Cuscuta europaea]
MQFPEFQEGNHHYFIGKSNANALSGEDDRREFESLRRALMVEKWMENFTGDTVPAASARFGSDPYPPLSSSSREHSDNARKSSVVRYPGDLNRLNKQPISPGRKLCKLLNSIFGSKIKQRREEAGERSSVRKSKSMKATATNPPTPCLSKTASSKPKRSVRFCPVDVILDDSSFRPGKAVQKGNGDDDGSSCHSSDLFELEGIGIDGGVEAISGDELPVYGTIRSDMMKAKEAISRRRLYM